MHQFNGQLKEFERALLEMDRPTAQRILESSAGGNISVHQVESLIVPVLDRIGSGWETGNIALAQVYMAGRICEDLVDRFLPTLGLNAEAPEPEVAIAMLDDYHPLGKRIVYSMLRASGHDLLDFGRVEARELVAKARAEKIRILLISTLMLPSALNVANVCSGLADDDIKIVVGGAPFRLDEKLWQHVGADAMGRSASEAIRIVADLKGEVA